MFNDIYTLTIYNVRYEDVGRFTLNAENSWGKATCTAELFVPPTTRIGKRQSIAKEKSYLLLLFNQYTMFYLWHAIASFL